MLQLLVEFTLHFPLLLSVPLILLQFQVLQALGFPFYRLSLMLEGLQLGLDILGGRVGVCCNWG
jgi:hypothetical protein